MQEDLFNCIEELFATRIFHARFASCKLVIEWGKGKYSYDFVKNAEY